MEPTKTTTPAGGERDPRLWEIAQRRVSFRYHLAVYIIVNAFLWGVWLFSGSRSYTHSGWPWPVWPMFGWGIGLLFHFLGAYVFHKETSVEREYEKLTRNKH